MSRDCVICALQRGYEEQSTWVAVDSRTRQGEKFAEAFAAGMAFAARRVGERYDEVTESACSKHRRVLETGR